MRFDVQIVAAELEEQTPRIGDIYPTKGGTTTAWVVVAVSSNQTAHLLGIDKHGNICSTTSRGFWVLQERVKIGRIADLEDLVLAVQAY